MDIEMSGRTSRYISKTTRRRLSNREKCEVSEMPVSKSIQSIDYYSFITLNVLY